MQRLQTNACDDDIFAAYPISRMQLEKVLGVTRSTIKKWEKILYWRLPAFREQYPTRKVKGTIERNTEAKLRPYQIWCLGRFGRLSRFHSIEEMKLVVETNPEAFSLAAYRHAYKEIKSSCQN